MLIGVTGATGYIGKHLTHRLLKTGYQVRCLTRHDIEGNGSLTYHKGSLEDLNSLRGFTEGLDILFHCAAEIKNPQKMYQINVEGTAHLIEVAKGKIGKWVQLSSVGVYGKYQSGIIDESSPMNPNNAYEISKAQSDLLLRDAGSRGYFQYTLLRPSTVFSWDMPSQFLLQMTSMIKKGYFFYIGRPSVSANYIHVSSVVDALLLVSTHEVANGQTYNLSNHCTLEEFIEQIALALSVPPPRARLPEPLVRFLCRILQFVPHNPLTTSRVDALTTRSFYSTAKIETELGYQHSQPLPVSIYETVQKWYDNR